VFRKAFTAEDAKDAEETKESSGNAFLRLLRVLCG